MPGAHPSRPRSPIALRLAVAALLIALQIAVLAPPAFAQPGISISDDSVLERNAGSTTAAVFTVTLSEASVQLVTVAFTTADGTATAPADYTPAAGVLTFLPGQKVKSVSVTVNGDNLDEDDETFAVNLSLPVNATIADAQGVGTILDNDNPPVVSIGNASVPEGNAGTADAVFAVTLSAASGKAVTVDFATAPGTATAGTDYVTASDAVLIPAGQVAGTAVVTVNGDVVDEPDETFFVNLSNPGNATIGDGQGLGTILDDDPGPTISIDDVTVAEGNAGTVNATFTVSLSEASARTVTVQAATADGTATAPSDYAEASGTVVFGPGETARPFTVVVNGDTGDEPDETFAVNLSGATNATILDGEGTGTPTTTPHPAFRSTTSWWPRGTRPRPRSPSGSPCRRQAARPCRWTSPPPTAAPRPATATTSPPAAASPSLPARR